MWMLPPYRKGAEKASVFTLVVGDDDNHSRSAAAAAAAAVTRHRDVAFNDTVEVVQFE